MYKTVKDAKDLFESITSLRVEGTEFYKASEILDAILREAHTGYNLCKDALQQAVEVDAMSDKKFLEKQILEIAYLLDPDCPDCGAYLDGHCCIVELVKGRVVSNQPLDTE